MNLKKSLKTQATGIKNPGIVPGFYCSKWSHHTAKLSPQAQVRLALGLLK